MTIISKDVILEPEISILKELKLQLVLYIYYLVQFSEKLVHAFINSRSKMNTINPNFAKKLDFRIWQTKVSAWKIDGSSLKTFGMRIVIFSIDDKTERL